MEYFYLPWTLKFDESARSETRLQIGAMLPHFSFGKKRHSGYSLVKYTVVPDLPQQRRFGHCRRSKTQNFLE
jgi:hypothetical protein